MVVPRRRIRITIALRGNEEEGVLLFENEQLL